jgi:hypothetical protein
LIESGVTFTDRQAENRATLTKRTTSSIDLTCSPSSDRSGKKKPNISLFPDPTRHQHSKSAPQLRITIPHQESKGEAGSCDKYRPTMSMEERLTGLAKAKRRALERRKDGTSPLFEDLNRNQNQNRMFLKYYADNRRIAYGETSG